MSTVERTIGIEAVAKEPPAPGSLAETGLTPEQVIDLLLKILYTQGARSGQQLTEVISLPFDIVDEQLFRLQERRLIEVIRTTGPARGNYVFDLGDAGRERAREALTMSQYVGPAPVSLRDYRQWIEAQSVRHLRANRARIRHGFDHLVLDDHLLESLGPAVNSASSVFLHGDPGNGKTVIAEAIANLFGGDMYVPYAVDIDGQIMALFDPVYHEPVRQEHEASEAWLRDPGQHDRRFVRVKRPVVFVGGELSLEQLDLQYDVTTKIYQAPFQLKAAGGILIIDDFGRQLVAPHDLLNRWIVPLEKGVDFLTLHTGVKFPVPFDCLLVFATNLDPHDLVDEAFLRRIKYKISVHDPERAQYEEIFRREAERRGIAYDPKAVDWIYRHYYEGRGIHPRACHPRDILEHLVHVADFEERAPSMSDGLLGLACSTYFLVMAQQNARKDPA